LLSQGGEVGKLVVVEPGTDLRGDDELLMATVAGDADAFGEFYRRHVAVVVGFLVRRTGSYELAADLGGETFAAALLACRRYRPGGAPAVAWLLGIAQNKLRESVRRGRVDQRARERLGMPVLLLDDDDLARVEELAGEGEPALSLLERLPAPQREAVRARVLADRSYRELAVELGCSEQVVRQHVSRGLKRLRALMKEQA
jgi:RNA polymerase sigma factor (sigma-70 family)